MPRWTALTSSTRTTLPCRRRCRHRPRGCVVRWFRDAGPAYEHCRIATGSAVLGTRRAATGDTVDWATCRAGTSPFFQWWTFLRISEYVLRDPSTLRSRRSLGMHKDQRTARWRIGGQVVIRPMMYFCALSYWTTALLTRKGKPWGPFLVRVKESPGKIRGV